VLQQAPATKNHQLCKWSKSISNGPADVGLGTNFSGPLAELWSKLLKIAGVDQSWPWLLSLAALAVFHPPPLNFTVY
jgi:hypothetical protein